ncbi:hypothetical protein [Spartinivicinus ruber]|uniref:hypothetical protein n=1 Tax=Spartinivicinus ruber TaxID=2683272 RepID=UPI0013D30AE4|nr:hypothetical protein [Spartinivicinus ruber]
MKTIVLLLINLILSSTANAIPIEFTHTGIGSGSIGNTNFLNKNITFTAFGDTEDRIKFDGHGFAIQHLTAKVKIDGLGIFDFISKTRTFVNNNSAIVGFSRSVDLGHSGTDLYNGPSDSLFNTWDMLSSTNLISGSARFLQWGVDIITNSGVLLFENVTSSTASFKATIKHISEPPFWPLMMVGMAGLLLRRTFVAN